MSESPRSEKELCLTRFSTPVPELDDHRFQLDAPRIEATPDMSLNRQHTAPQGFSTETPQRSDLLQVQNALREAGSFSRDFEQAVVDDDHSVDEPNGLGRRVSVDPTGNVRHVRTFSRNHQDIGTVSRKSSVSARSTSPPNSVEAFADPRRRERANTLESHGAPDLEAILQRTVSGGTHARRPTFSNASIIRPQPGDIQLDSTDDVCVPTFEQPGRIPVIDYEELEEFVALNQKTKPAAWRKHSLSSQGRKSRVFYDLRPGAQKSEDVDGQQPSSEEFSSGDFLDAKVHEKVQNDKELLDNLKNENEPTRFGFFSSESQSTVHAADLGDLVLPGDTFRDLFQLGPDGGVWWLDVLNPTEDEVGALSRAFSIHPLTTEDILTQEAREKVELFKQYYFVCFRTFYQMDKSSEQFMEPVNFYMVVFRDGVLSFSFTDNPHAANVRRRIGKLRDYVSLSSDWICYAMIDDIVDSFGPVIREIEVESEAIEDLVFIARMDDFESFLPRIGGLRKKVMSLMRLLGGKADVIRGFSKRCNEQYSVTPRGDIGLYLGDIQDHVVTMMSNLAHFEKMLSRSHTNYLAQLNVTNLVLGNHVNKVLSKVTLIATMLVPMNLICGLFGMNVPVPGENSEGLGWWFGILGVIAAVIILSGVAARFYKLSTSAETHRRRRTLLILRFDGRCWSDANTVSFVVNDSPPFLSPGPSSLTTRQDSAVRGTSSMRPKTPSLQGPFGATVSALVFYYVIAFALSAHVVHATDHPASPAETPGSLFLAADDSPLSFASYNGLVIDDLVDDAGETRGLDLVRRAPNGIPSLGNNQYKDGGVERGVTQWWYFPKDGTNRTSDSDGQDNNRNSTRSNLVYLSLTACSKPTPKDSGKQPPQLQMYVSKSASLQKPGPGADSKQQEVYTAVEGYANTTIAADGDVYVGVWAPNSTEYSGSYTYQIAASTDALFHMVVNVPFLFFVDSDTHNALFTTQNLTTDMFGLDTPSQLMNMTPPYTMFANNVDDSSIDGLRRSYCALNTLAQIGKGDQNIKTSMTNRGLGSKPKQQFYLTGLNKTSTYTAILAKDGNSTDSGNGIVGGGGEVYLPRTFNTKTEDNCAVVYDLPFCSEVAYAVPFNPNKNLDDIRQLYDDNAAKLYKNFTYSLDQVQCNATKETRFSLATTCQDCSEAYKQWLCAVTIPRCADFSNPATFLHPRNVNQSFHNNTSPAITNATQLNHPAYTQSRNPLIDREIRPGPYKEILPCRDVCYTLVQSCPSVLGFQCPTDKWLDLSYGKRPKDGNITCSYPGAAYFLSAGRRLSEAIPYPYWII
ncbi:stretch-activated Ca2+-permeable channel component-domain-containing protein [Aspergillus ambiguus]|uniref:magnesium transporter CorA family protein n=1 Tax=Aspergillus ambiguus TaxID=176160 RepID=UPI003CCE1CA9